MDLSALWSKIQQNLKDTDQLQKDTSAQVGDRIAMMNPAQQGPHLPQHTPEEKQYANELIGAMAGSVAPVGPKLAAAKDAATGVYDMAQAGAGGMKQVIQKQQGLSRAADMSDRFASQLAAAKKAALARFTGR